MLEIEEKQHRRNARKFSCTIVGFFVLFIVLILLIVFVIHQYDSIDALTLAALSGEAEEGGIPVLYNVSYEAKIADEPVPIEGISLNLEDHGNIEFVCQDNQVIAQSAPSLSRQDSSYLVSFRLTNHCANAVTIRICWFNSIFGLFFPPNCGI